VHVAGGLTLLSLYKAMTARSQAPCVAPVTCTMKKLKQSLTPNMQRPFNQRKYKMKQIIVRVERKDDIDVPTHMSIETVDEADAFECDKCGCSPDVVFGCYDGYMTVNLCPACYIICPPDEE